MIEKLKKPINLKLFLLRYLPMAFFAGLKLQKFEPGHTAVSVPFNWITKNPFKSMYFAVQAMAAEFSTAVLLVRHIEASGSDIALIVVSIKADFLKRAQTRTTFTCDSGTLVQETVEKAVNSGMPEVVTLNSIGRNLNNETVSEFQITWSLKKRVS